jgi:carbon-monoxide dehydrogenase medium subunit
MKPQSFEYAAPVALDEALALLAERGDEAKVLAGGQSLVPMLNLRLARPGLLVDINRLPGLSTVESSAGGVRLGALVRHRDLERGAVDGPLGRLLAGAARAVGHPPIRARGTVCGSLAHADPAAEWCLVGVAAGARVDVASVRGSRTLSVHDLLDSPLVTALEPDELILAVTFPHWAPGRVGAGFAERARTAGAFAELAACVVVRAREGGRIGSADVAVAGVGGRATRLPDTSARLAGEPLTRATAAEGAACAAREIRPGPGGEPPEGYLRAVTEALVEGALAQAFSEVGPAWR